MVHSSDPIEHKCEKSFNITVKQEVMYIQFSKINVFIQWPLVELFYLYYFFVCIPINDIFVYIIKIAEYYYILVIKELEISNISLNVI